MKKEAIAFLVNLIEIIENVDVVNFNFKIENGMHSWCNGISSPIFFEQDGSKECQIYMKWFEEKDVI